MDWGAVKVKSDYAILKYYEDNIKSIKRIIEQIKVRDTFSDIEMVVDTFKCQVNVRELQIHLNDQLYIFEKLAQRLKSKIASIEKTIEENS